MRDQTRNDYNLRMLRVLRHIQDNLDQELTPQGLARVAHFSPTHFHRVFKGMLDESLMEHVRRLRLERAALRLEFTDNSVTDIGLEAGFETLEAFSRAFKALLGRPPSHHRQHFREKRLQGVASGVHYLPREDRGHLTLNPRSLTMDVSIKTIDSVRVAYVRHTGPYQGCETAWNTLCAWAGPKGLFGPQSMFIGLCHDDPMVTPPDKIRYDACLTVPGDVRPEGPVGVMDIFGGEWAVHRYVGPYEGLQETYNNLFGVWLPGSGREYGDGPSAEIYLNDPKTTPPDKLETEIRIPLKPKAG